MSFDARSKTSPKVVESYLFHDVIWTRTAAPGEDGNEGSAGEPRSSMQRRIVVHWDRVFIAAVIAALGLFLCARLAGLQA